MAPGMLHFSKDGTVNHPEMSAKLRILHLEDDPDFSLPRRWLLDSQGFEIETALVATREEFEAPLARERFDIILADYLLPSYNGLQALQFACAKAAETPFLLVSGTLGEQAAIDSLQNGAKDYVLKHWPERLVPAIRRAVKEAEDRNRRKRAETELIRLSKLGQSLSSASSPAEAARIICSVSDELFAWEAFKLDLYSAQNEKISPMLCVETDQTGRRYEVSLDGESLSPTKLAKRSAPPGPALIEGTQ